MSLDGHTGTIVHKKLKYLDVKILGDVTFISTLMSICNSGLRSWTETHSTAIEYPKKNAKCHVAPNSPNLFILLNSYVGLCSHWLGQEPGTAGWPDVLQGAYATS